MFLWFTHCMSCRDRLRLIDSVGLWHALSLAVHEAPLFLFLPVRPPHRTSDKGRAPSSNPYGDWRVPLAS